MRTVGIVFPETPEKPKKTAKKPASGQEEKTPCEEEK